MRRYKIYFHFYCDDEDPEHFPESLIMWATEASREYILDRIGEFPKKFGDDPRWAVVLKCHEEIRDRFIQEVKWSAGFELFNHLDWVMVEKFVKAKDIPQITKRLIEMGWEEKYIPFGP